MRLVQDMNEDSEIVVRCAVGVTDVFKEEVGLPRESAMSSFLFVEVMDRLRDEVRQESAHDTVTV